LGHSSSLAFARLIDAAPPPIYVPDPDGALLLRAVARGQTDRLISAHHLHQGVESRVLPCTFMRYREGQEPAAEDVAASVFSGDWIVFARASGPRLPSTSTVGVARQLRRALLAGGGAPLNEVLSGHRDDGAAADRPHLAVVPLPDVGSRHSHGGILGVALILPRGDQAVSAEQRTTLLRAIGHLEARTRAAGGVAAEPGDGPAFDLLLGEAGVLELERVVWGEHKSKGLRARTWCEGSRRWGTATPIALDRNPGDLHHPDPTKRARAFDEATALVAEAVQRIGLPAPTEISVVRSCVVAGTAKPLMFPRFPISTDRPQRVLVHARLHFTDKVSGPILLGAGRYFGLGLCRPLDDDDDDEHDEGDGLVAAVDPGQGERS
jgi:CRISPR-associated protein Csb2